MEEIQPRDVNLAGGLVDILETVLDKGVFY